MGQHASRGESYQAIRLTQQTFNIPTNCHAYLAYKKSTILTVELICKD